MRECQYCKLDKPVDLFHSKNQCRECRNARKRRYYQENLNKEKARCKKYRDNNRSKLNKIRREWASKNKEKISFYDSKYRSKHKEKLRESKKKYREENKERLSSKDRIWKKNNKDKVKESNKRYYAKVMADPKRKLRARVSNAMYKSLKSTDGLSKIKFLLYTMNDLKMHLESLFEDWMNWDNWGLYRPDSWDDNDKSTWTWQIDHIIPVSSFSFQTINDEEFKKCWALSNLRPLSSKINCIEGAKLSQKERASSER